MNSIKLSFLFWNINKKDLNVVQVETTSFGSHKDNIVKDNKWNGRWKTTKWFPNIAQGRAAHPGNRHHHPQPRRGCPTEPYTKTFIRLLSPARGNE